MIIFVTTSQNRPSGGARPARHPIYHQLAAQFQELNDNLGGLPSPLEASDIWRGIWIEETHNSTAIEGNTLVLKQVERLLVDDRAVGNKELREYLEVKGYADAAEWVYRQAANPAGRSPERPILTLQEVRSIHNQVMSRVWQDAPHPAASAEEGPGSFRQHEIEPFPGGMKPTTWPLIPAELDAWIEDVNRLRTDDNIFERLAAFHSRFEQIHPFLDGNGRTGRLLLNLILIRFGYPPVIIYKRDREKYLRALQKADDGKPGPLGRIIARALLDNLHRFIFPAVAGPARVIPLAALSTPKELPALRAAAQRGRLKAFKGADGQWRSSQRWVEEYKSSRYKRERPESVISRE